VARMLTSPALKGLRLLAHSESHLTHYNALKQNPCVPLLERLGASKIYVNVFVAVGITAAGYTRLLKHWLQTF